ncbi:MAG: phospholipase D family protein [Deltaproteobacteria bacterium]|nr:phospholipase D family protein [Deltaproteobacteria bacterium]
MSAPRPLSAALLSGSELYREVVLDKLVHARESVSIATANVKDMFIEQGGTFRSITEAFVMLAERGVRLRLLHAELPSRPFRKSFDRKQELVRGGLDLKICPRVHFKAVIVDGAWIYLGSANLTGAGLGAKGDDKRNFELGFVTEDFDTIDRATALFEAVWSGAECGTCKLFEVCPDPIGDGPPKKSKRRGKGKGGAGSLVQLGKARRFGR